MTHDPQYSYLPANATLDQVTPDALCSLGPRPYLITGAFVQTMRQHFTSRDQIEDPVLKHLIWSELPITSIVIESITRWKPDTSGQRPAVLVKRNDIDFSSRGINDQYQGFYNLDGRDFYEAAGQGTYTFQCIDSEEGGAERLGYEVYRELIQFGPMLRHYLQLQRFKVVKLSGVAKSEEAVGSYVVGVTVFLAFQECWVITSNAPRLKRIVLDKIVSL
jgi:hypothetical protein